MFFVGTGAIAPLSTGSGQKDYRLPVPQLVEP